MKRWTFTLEPPLTRLEKRVLLIIVPPAGFACFLAGVRAGRWLLSLGGL